MKLGYIVFLIGILSISTSSNSVVDNSDIEISKSLKILNIHDTEGPEVLLA
jgi:hypothetical protein